jgi:hypothetical protein
VIGAALVGKLPALIDPAIVVTLAAAGGHYGQVAVLSLPEIVTFVACACIASACV